MTDSTVEEIRAVRRKTVTTIFNSIAVLPNKYPKKFMSLTEFARLFLGKSPKISSQSPLSKRVGSMMYYDDAIYSTTTKNLGFQIFTFEILYEICLQNLLPKLF
jgi:hypothetical protein